MIMDYKTRNKLVENVKTRQHPGLISAYKKVRIQFEEKHLKLQTNWSKIIFVDKKKFISKVQLVLIHIDIIFERKWSYSLRINKVEAPYWFEPLFS